MHAFESASPFSTASLPPSTISDPHVTASQRHGEAAPPHYAANAATDVVADAVVTGLSPSFATPPPPTHPPPSSSSSLPTAYSPGDISSVGAALAEHQSALGAMRRQFALMERAFLTLEGLCRTQIQLIDDSERRLFANQTRAVERFQEWQRVHHGIVKLDVGGVKFHVSQATLLKFPGSLFDVLLSSQFPIERDEEGYIFMDRDPELFSELLHFLRTGDSSTLRLLPPLTRRRVTEEAKYYGFDLLLMELKSTRLEWICESSFRNVVTGELPAPRCFAAAQFVGLGAVYLFGGCTANDVFFDSLYKVQVRAVDALTELGAASGSDEALDALSDGERRSSLQAGASFVGAGSGTTLSQQQWSGVPSTNSNAHGNAHGAGNAPATGVAAMASAEDQQHMHPGGGVGGGSGSAGVTPRPERFEFTLVRPRGDCCPPARSGHAMVYLQGHLMLLYGNDKTGHVHEVYAFNIYTQSWSIMPCRGDYVEPRSGHSVTVVRDKLWLIGGKQIFPTMKAFGDLYEGTIDFELEVLTWRAVQPALIYPEGSVVEKRGYHSAAAYADQHIIIHGGIVRDVYSSDVCLYDTVNNAWRCLVQGDPAGYVPSPPRSGHHAVIHNDQMIVFGSYSEDHPYMQLYAFCCRTFVWRRLPTSGRGPTRRAAPSGVLLPQDTSTSLLPRVLLFGGFDITSRKCFQDVFTVTL